MTGEVDVGRSFVRLIVPFTFDPAQFEAMAARAGAVTWRLRDRSHEVWKPLALPFEDLIPSVAAFWNNADDRPAAGRFWCMQDQVLRSPLGLGGSHPWTVSTRSGDTGALPAAVELALFGSGAGSVTFDLQVRPTRDAARPCDPGRLDTWGQLAYDGRFLAGRRAAGVTLVKDQEPTTLLALALRLLQTIAGDESSSRLTLPGVAFPFAALFLTGVPIEQTREAVVRLRYNTRFDTEMELSPDDLLLDGEGVLLRRPGAWLFCSLTSAGFVGADVPDDGYYRQFPAELRRAYSLAVVVTLQQRGALLAVTETVSERWLEGDPANRVTAFGELQTHLQYLTARSMASQILHRNNQHRFYAMVQEALGVRHLYDEVRGSVNDLSEAVRLELSERMEAQARRFEQRVSMFALLFGLPSLVLAFIGANIRGVTSPNAVSFALAVALVVVSLAVGALVGLAVRRGQRSR